MFHGGAGGDETSSTSAHPGRPTIAAGFLAEVGTEPGGADRARYQTVVVPSAGALTDPAEATALADYERRYGIRRVESYVWPDSTVGLSGPDYSGPLDGADGLVTPAGHAGPFGYLRGPVPFEDNAAAVVESWGHLAQPLPTDPVTGAAFTPLLTGTTPDGQTTGPLLGQYTADGRERLISTSTDVGGVSEAVADTGLVVPPRDPAAMADACLRLLRDDALRHRLGAAARHRALELFTVDQAVDAFAHIYARLAAGRDPPTRPGTTATPTTARGAIAAAIPRQRVAAQVPVIPGPGQTG